MHFYKCVGNYRFTKCFLKILTIHYFICIGHKIAQTFPTKQVLDAVPQGTGPKRNGGCPNISASSELKCMIFWELNIV